MSPLIIDLKNGFRQLRKSPVLRVMAVLALALALGIGAPTTLFGALRELVLDPFPCKRNVEKHFAAHQEQAAVEFFNGPIKATAAAKESILLVVPTHESDREIQDRMHAYVNSVQKRFYQGSPVLTDTEANQPIPQAAGRTLLSPEQMRADLDFTVKTLQNVHPATTRGFSEQQQATIDAAYQHIQTPMAAKAFFFIVNSVICSLQDGHTQLHPMRHAQVRLIDVPLIGLHDGFYVRDMRAPFQQGDRVVAIGHLSMERIYERMRNLIPSENEHHRQWSMADKIQREEYLDYLKVIDNDTVTLRVDRAGEVLTLIAPLKPAAQCLHPQPQRSWVGYQFDHDHSLGIFHLDACHANDHYKETVKAFFEEVRKNRIQNVAIDVRRNGGGNSRVMTIFLQYLNIDRYRHFGGDVRFSKEIAEKTPQTKSSGYYRGKPYPIKNDKVKDASLLFDGDLFVLTSPQTFSSGNWFAVIVKDNALGTVIGEPTGNAPTSYGDVVSFQMPNTGFGFSVSYKK